MRDRAPELLEDLQSMGVAEILPHAADPSREEAALPFPDTAARERRIADLKASLEFLRLFEDKQGFMSSLIASFLPAKRSIEMRELRELEASPGLEKAMEEVREMRDRLDRAKEEHARIQEAIIQLRVFEGTTLHAGEHELDRVAVIAGISDSSGKEQLERAVEGLPWMVEWGKEGAVILAVPREDEGRAEEMLRSSGFREQEVWWSKPASRSIAELEHDAEQALRIRETINMQARRMRSIIPDLEALVDWHSWELEKERFLHMTAKTASYAVMELWVPAVIMDAVRDRIRVSAPGSLVREVEPKEREQAPIVMKNGAWSRAFEIVTRVYGFPKAGEPDPTPFLAPFFLLFFALALSDAGYGLVILLACLLARAAVRDKGAKLFFALFALCGALTIPAGIVAGTVFGTEVAAGYRILDPVNDPVGTLLVMFVLGGIQLFCGLLIGMAWKMRQGEVREALSGNGAAMILFAGAALGLAAKDARIALAGVIAMTVVSIAFSPEKRMVRRLLGGFGSLYSIVGYFSDILSYSRLLALGLATGIIAMVVNMIAFLFADMIPIPALGWLVAGGVMVAGHGINLLLSGLGAFVHAARLQFVEYFSKFMEGGGRGLRPFAKQGRYVEIIQ